MITEWLPLMLMNVNSATLHNNNEKHNWIWAYLIIFFLHLINTLITFRNIYFSRHMINYIMTINKLLVIRNNKHWRQSSFTRGLNLGTPTQIGWCIWVCQNKLQWAVQNFTGTQTDQGSTILIGWHMITYWLNKQV